MHVISVAHEGHQKQKYSKSAMKQHYRKLNPEFRADAFVVTIKITISMNGEPFHLTSTHLYEDETKSFSFARCFKNFQ